MYYAHQQAVAGYDADDHLSLSLRAAKTAELMQAVRAQRKERKAQRKAHRAVRNSQESYTTAV